MTARLKTASAALILALAFTASAHAQVVQGLDGRWEGPLASGSGAALTLIFRVETKAGKTTAQFDLPEQGAKDIEGTVSREGDKVTLGVPAGQLKFTGTLAADGSKITGEISEGGGPGTAVVLAHNVSTYKPATTAAVQGLDGNWTGQLSTPIGDVAVVMRISTKDGRTTTLMDSPTQSVTDIPAMATRNGQSVFIDVPGTKGTFQATLSADGKTLDGQWSQNGMDYPLQLKKP